MKEKQSKCLVKYISSFHRLHNNHSKENYKLIYEVIHPFSYLKTKESYGRWVTRRLWGFRQQISKAKYLKMSVENIRKLQENTAALYTKRKTLQVSAIRGSGYVWPKKLKRPPLPSRCQESDAKCQRTKFLPGWNELCRKRDRLPVHGVGTPLPDDTECAWLFGSTPSGFPKRTCGALPLSGLP